MPDFPPKNKGLLPYTVVSWCREFGSKVSSHSTNGTDFSLVTLRGASNGTWEGNTTMKYALFNPVDARYMRLTATGSLGGSKAEISELDFGYEQLIQCACGARVENYPEIIPTTISPANSTGLFTQLSGWKPSYNGYPRQHSKNNESATYFSIDGRQLYRSAGGVSMLLRTFGSRAFVVKRETDR